MCSINKKLNSLKTKFESNLYNIAYWLEYPNNFTVYYFFELTNNAVRLERHAQAKSL